MSIDRQTALAHLAAALAGEHDQERMRQRLRLRRPQLAVLREALSGADGADASTPARVGSLAQEAAAAAAVEAAKAVEVARAAASEITALRPPARDEIDQVHTTAHSLARRACFLHEHQRLAEQSLLFLGDDDLCSLTLCALTRPRRVLVVDIDPAVLGAIERRARAHDLPIETLRWDLCRFVDEGLPAGLEARFDAFVTDPPYTEAGMRLFCAAGLAALRRRPGVAAYVAVPWMMREAWSDELLHAVQGALLGEGFVLSDVLRGFAAYEHDDGLLSSMVRAEAFVHDWSPQALLEPYQRKKLYSSRKLGSGGRA